MGIILGCCRKWQCALVCLLVLLVMSACCAHPSSSAYEALYAHLKNPPGSKISIEESDFFLILLVDAPHLDYTDTHSLLKTVAKHPNDGGKNGDVGHAWIYLSGRIHGKPFVLEGGHSGERGFIQAKYFDGVMNSIDYGYANPTKEQMRCPCVEPNPVKYLWESQNDGFFQSGSGGHRPTCAAKMDISEIQFQRILTFIDPRNYHYEAYALTGNQCSSFVAQVAAIAGFPIEDKIVIPIDQTLTLGGQELKLWSDLQYSILVISSPDIIERSLIQAIAEKKAENALSWYLQTHPLSLKEHLMKIQETAMRFPKRFCRYLQMH
jgi:hypothetical protein